MLARILLLLGIYLMPGIHAVAQGKDDDDHFRKKQQAYEQLLNLVHSRQFVFTGEWAIPTRGPRVNLTTRPNKLTVHGDSATADFPYFGRAFSGGYGNGKGISFDAGLESYDVKTNDKKQQVAVRFRVQGKEDRYTCTLNVYGPENASLSVVSNHRQQIRYDGAIAAL